MPLQGATPLPYSTQGVALGYGFHWAFSPFLINPKLELHYRATSVLRQCALAEVALFGTLGMSII